MTCPVSWRLAHLNEKVTDKALIKMEIPDTPMDARNLSIYKNYKNDKTCENLGSFHPK